MRARIAHIEQAKSLTLSTLMRSAGTKLAPLSVERERYIQCPLRHLFLRRIEDVPEYHYIAITVGGQRWAVNAGHGRNLLGGSKLLPPSTLRA